MKKIYRLPERLMPGTYKAIIQALDLVDVTSKKGNRYEEIQFKLLALYEQYGITMPAYYKVSYSWYADGKLAKLSKDFSILPDIGEEFQIESLIHMPVEIKVEENVYNGKVYSNVVDMVPIDGDLPKLLQEWLDQHCETRQMTDALFDDEDEIPEEEEPEDVNSEEEDTESENEADSAFSPKKLAPPQRPPVNQIKRRTPISSGSSSGFPIKKSQVNQEEHGEL